MEVKDIKERTCGINGKHEWGALVEWCVRCGTYRHVSPRTDREQNRRAVEGKEIESCKVCDYCTNGPGKSCRYLNNLECDSYDMFEGRKVMEV